MKSVCWRVIIAALITMARERNRPKCPLTDKWIHRWCSAWRDGPLRAWHPESYPQNEATWKVKCGSMHWWWKHLSSEMGGRGRRITQNPRVCHSVRNERTLLKTKGWRQNKNNSPKLSSDVHYCVVLTHTIYTSYTHTQKKRNVLYTYNGVLFSYKKKKILSFVSTLMNLKELC